MFQSFLILILLCLPTSGEYFKTAISTGFAFANLAFMNGNVAMSSQVWKRRYCCLYMNGTDVSINSTMCSCLHCLLCRRNHVASYCITIVYSCQDNDSNLKCNVFCHRRSCLECFQKQGTENKSGFAGNISKLMKQCRWSNIRKLTYKYQRISRRLSTCKISYALVNSNKSNSNLNIHLRQLPILSDKRLARKKRHIPNNKSSAYFEYFTQSRATQALTSSLVSQSLEHQRVVTLNISDYKPNIKPTSYVWYCAKTIVVNNSTVVDTSYIQKTLVPTTTVPQVMHHTVVYGGNTSTGNSTSMINTTLTFVSTIRNITHTFLPNHSSVSMVRSTLDTNDHVYITTVTCVPYIGPVTVSTHHVFFPPNTTARVAEDDGLKDAKLLIIVAVIGGSIFTFCITVILFFLIKRYRRLQSLRRKKKQISYFNRYDRSSVWDEEPFGGSRLSVFTLKNSKFDIDWEPSDGKKAEEKSEDYEGR